MKAVAYFEADIPRCSLTYGVAPCTASIPATGDIKCFNSLGTCQDRANFSDDPVTLRFAEDVGFLPREIEAFPFIKKVDFTPPIVSLNGDLGQRATLKVTFRQAQHSDAGPIFDKYPADRDYDDPFNRGTFWGKFRARDPFLRGRSCRLIRGLIPDEFANTYLQGDPLPADILDEQEIRHFVIESIAGPMPRGEFAIVAKDVLKLADGDRALAPELSNGFLVAGISAVASSATLSPTGIGNDEYPASGFATIGGKEVVSFTRSGDVLTISRAQLNTVAVAHSTSDRVQVMLRYAGEDGADILADLWDRAGADSDFIPLAAWQAETAAFLGRVYTLNITEPTSINKLISEMLEYMGAAQWWDDVNQLIRLQILRAVSTTADRYNEDNVMEGSLDVVEQPDKRVSRVIIYFGQVNPVKRIDDLENYRSSELVLDEQSEADEGTSSIKTIFARGIAAGGRSVATTLGAKYLSRYVRAPRRFAFELMQYAGQMPALGGGYRLGGGDPRIASWPFEDETGSRVDCPMQVTRIHPEGKVEAEEMLFEEFGTPDDPTIHTIIFDANENNINLRTRHDELYPVPVSGDEVVVYINSGVVIGSSSTSVPAFDVGGWPAGVTRTINHLGRIEGCGGDGGPGAVIDANGIAGLAGGVALYTRVTIALVQSGGQVWGGGGGGGSGAGGSAIGARAGGGGGGGGGQFPGSGGAAGVGSSPGSAGSTEAGGGGGAGGGIGGNNTAGAGGTGGDPGSAGVNGGANAFVGHPGGTGGSPGAAIDGVSFVTPSGSGDRRGPEIN